MGLKIMVDLKTRTSKLRDKVLDAIRIGYPNTSEYKEYPDGNNMEGIASCIYGPNAIHERGETGNFISQSSLDLPFLRNSIKATLTRTLKKLWIDGLILKCLPVFKVYWEKKTILRKILVGIQKRTLLVLRDFDTTRMAGLRQITLKTRRLLTERKLIDLRTLKISMVTTNGLGRVEIRSGGCWLNKITQLS